MMDFKKPRLETNTDFEKDKSDQKVSGDIEMWSTEGKKRSMPVEGRFRNSTWGWYPSIEYCLKDVNSKIAERSRNHRKSLRDWVNENGARIAAARKLHRECEAEKAKVRGPLEQAMTILESVRQRIPGTDELSSAMESAVTNVQKIVDVMAPTVFIERDTNENDANDDSDIPKNPYQYFLSRDHVVELMKQPSANLNGWSFRSPTPNYTQDVKVPETTRFSDEGWCIDVFHIDSDAKRRVKHSFDTYIACLEHLQILEPPLHLSSTRIREAAERGESFGDVQIVFRKKD